MLFMEMNLNIPFSPIPSPPHNPEVVFFSRHSDSMLFERGSTIEISCQIGRRALKLSWELARNLFRRPVRTGTGEALPANQFVIRLPSDGLQPGFYDLRIVADCGDDAPLRGICTFGYRIDDIRYRLTRPHNFGRFWDEGRVKVAAVPLSPESGSARSLHGEEIDRYNVTEAGLPPRYDPDGHRCEEVEVRKISFAGLGGMRIRGWLAKPTGAGPFPAMLVLPGAGFNSRPTPVEHARHGYLALDIQIHGQDVDQESYEEQSDYSVPCEPERYYYYPVYLNLIQAVNYLCARADVDPSRLVVVGGSQGGRLAVVAAALDPRIAAIVPAIAHFGNLPYTRTVEAANQSPAEETGGEEDAVTLPETPESRGLSYYDVMNFAPDVHCPVFMNAGLVDPVSPPSCVFAVYHMLATEDREIVPLPGLGHDWSAEFDRRAWRWLDARLRLR